MFRSSLLLAGLTIAATIHATNYYVSTVGNNSNNGLSLAMAFATIQYPIANNILLAGDTLFVENGTYVGFDNSSISGTPGAPLVFKALGNNVIISGPGGIRDDGINIEGVDYNIIDGFISNNMTGSGNGIRLVLANFCVVRNCTTLNNAERGIFTGFTDDIIIEHNMCAGSIDEHGIYVSNSSDRAIIRFNECYGNTRSGIQINADLSSGGDGISDDCQIYGNKVYENKLGAGINLDGVRNCKIFNNLIYENHFSQGITFHMTDGAVPSTGGKIFNNTIIVPTDGRWGILFVNGSDQNAVIYNNIILTKHASRGSISTTSTSTMISDYNIFSDRMNSINDDPSNATSLAQWQSNTGMDTHSVVGLPFNQIFLNEGNQDFHLVANSQALNIGTAQVSSVVISDYDGNPRPIGVAYDLGAYEQQDPDCAETLLTVSDPITQGVHSGAQIIQSDAMINQNVIFKASEAIELLPNFTAPLAFSFIADLLPCNQH